MIRGVDIHLIVDPNSFAGTRVYVFGTVMDELLSLIRHDEQLYSTGVDFQSRGRGVGEISTAHEGGSLGLSRRTA